MILDLQVGDDRQESLVDWIGGEPECLESDGAKKRGTSGRACDEDVGELPVLEPDPHFANAKEPPPAPATAVSYWKRSPR